MHVTQKVQPLYRKSKDALLAKQTKKLWPEQLKNTTKDQATELFLSTHNSEVIRLKN